MGRSVSTSEGKMISKSCIFLLGVVIAFAALASASEENQLAENVASAAARVVRSADPGKKKKVLKKKGKKNRKNNARKSKKNKAKKIRKNKKAKKGRKSKGRKQKKSRMDKKSRKNKKSRMNKKSRKNKGSKSLTGRTVDGDCLENAITAMKRWRDVVTNFEKQYSRITKQSGI